MFADIYAADVLVSVWNFFSPKARELMPNTDFADVNEFANSRHWQECEWIFNGHVWMYIAEAWWGQARPWSATCTWLLQIGKKIERHSFFLQHKTRYSH